MVPLCRCVQVFFTALILFFSLIESWQKTLWHICESVWLGPWRWRSSSVLEGTVPPANRLLEQESSNSKRLIGMLVLFQKYYIWQRLYFSLNDPLLFCIQWLEMEHWLSIIGFVSLVSFSFLKPAKIFPIHNTSQWPYWKKKLEEQTQISHAMTKWLKSCWIRKWRMHQFWDYKTEIRTFPLVNTGSSIIMSTKHATWLRIGDSGYEIDVLIPGNS